MAQLKLKQRFETIDFMHDVVAPAITDLECRLAEDGVLPEYDIDVLAIEETVE